MKTKIKTINLRGDYVEFRRKYGGKLIASIRATTTVKRRVVDARVEFKFSCLGGIMRSLNKAWDEERANKVGQIESIDRALGRSA